MSAHFTRPRGILALTTTLTAIAVLVGACGSQNAEEVVTVTMPRSGEVQAAASPENTAVHASAASSKPADAAPRVAATPAFGSTDVAPAGPITVTALGGAITDMTVTGDDGGKINGSIAEDKRTFTVTETLRYGTTYTFAGHAKSPGGAESEISGKMTTVNPDKFVEVASAVKSSQKYGVGQPIILYFTPAITDKAAAEKALKVTTDKGNIEGSWGWFQDEDIKGDGVLKSQVQFRPKEFWPANTKVTVNANFYGVNMGNGWGKDNMNIELNIDRKLIVQADVPSHHLNVLIDDKEWKNFPVSYGAPKDGRDTTSGIHLVQDKRPDFTMNNPRYGYSNVFVKWAVRINNNGEFIHENQKVADEGYLGKQNVSHGCVNMSEADAAEFYKAVLIGDPVVITGTTQPMTERDWNYVWIYSWDDWKKLSKAH